MVPFFLLLEIQLHGDLDLPCRGGSVGLGIGGVNDSELAALEQVTRAGSIRTGVEEMRMVKDVVTLKPRLQFEAFAQFHALGKYQVEVPETRTIELIAA